MLWGLLWFCSYSSIGRPFDYYSDGGNEIAVVAMMMR